MAAKVSILSEGKEEKCTCSTSDRRTSTMITDDEAIMQTVTRPNLATYT